MILWSSERHRAFRALKTCLTTAPLLVTPRTGPNEPALVVWLLRVVHTEVTGAGQCPLCIRTLPLLVRVGAHAGEMDRDETEHQLPSPNSTPRLLGPR